MITLYDIFNLIDPEAEFEILDFEGNLLHECAQGSTMSDCDLLERRVYKIFPGIVTKILLDEED